MSFYLAVGIPPQLVSKLRESLDSQIYIGDVTDFPIGRATTRGRSSWVAYTLQIGSSSASLVGKGAIRRTHNNDKSALLISGVEALLGCENVPSITLLLHWMSGWIQNEEVHATCEERVRIENLPETVETMQSDVRYIVCGNSSSATGSEMTTL
ncbi:MAG TPA: hypothetical protein VGK19_22420 [Capsulimonadaceae bacterium]|jgi:hypothetical protein